MSSMVMASRRFPVNCKHLPLSGSASLDLLSSCVQGETTT